MRALEKLSFDVDATHRTVHTSEVSVDLAQAVDHWTQHKWHDFGTDLGKLLQELVVLVFPSSYSQEYSVDQSVHETSWAPQLGWLATAAMVIAAALTWAVVRRGTTRSHGIDCDALATSDFEDDSSTETTE